MTPTCFSMIQKNFLPIIVLGLLVATAIPARVAGRNCGCSVDLCCNQHGYCGSGNDYCGMGCRQGPCSSTPATPSPSNASVSGRVTDAFFNGIAHQADSGCAGRGFFTRAAFLEALDSFQQFGRVGSDEDSKREIAAFFAHATHETGHFCYIEEINGNSQDYCQESNTQYPCEANKGYYGRGPLQLTWNSNYGPAGNSIGFDGLNNPELVASDPVVSFEVALWFWMNNVRSRMTSSQGFGQTIRAINGMECDGGDSGAVGKRVSYYTEYCNQLGVPAGNNLGC